MHKVTSSVTVGSIGDLGHIAGALAGAGYNIDAIGGGEALIDGKGVGVIAMLISPDEEEDEARIKEIIAGVQLDGGRTVQAVEIHPSFDLVLDDQPGQLAGAAGLIGSEGINIQGMVTIDVHSGWGVVALAFATETDRNTAQAVLVANDYTVLGEHGGRDRRLWVDEQLGGAQPPA